MEYRILDEPRKLINQHIPFSDRQVLSKAVTDAYQWSNLLLHNTTVFQTLRARKRLLPEIKNIAVEYFIVQAIKNGELPYRYRIGHNANHSHPYIELFNESILIHCNQVSAKHKAARKAYCRDRHLQPMRSYIDFGRSDIQFEEQRYFQLNHGYQTQEPSFITLGIPNQEGKLEASIYLLEEFSTVKGYYPRSRIETVDEISLEDFQRFAEGGGEYEDDQTSQGF